MKRMNFPNRKEQRRKEAAERQAEYDSLSLTQKWDKLVNARGESKKQAAKLFCSDVV